MCSEEKQFGISIECKVCKMVYTVYALHDISEEEREEIQAAVKHSRIEGELRQSIARFYRLIKNRLQLDGVGATMRTSVEIAL